jgi:signal transduction histidine kinase
LQNKTYAPMPDGESQSLFNSRPEIPPKLISTAIAQPTAPAHGDADGPNDGDLRIGVRAVKLPDRASPILIYVGINRASVNQAVGRFTLVMATALAVLALGLVVGVLVLIRYGLRPLHEIEGKLADVRAGRRDKLDGEYPRELAAVVKEINTLILQNRKVVERARTHVGNLAHALKTPLAVLLNESRNGKDKMSELVRRQSEAMSSNVQQYLKRAQAAAQAEVLGARTDMREPVEGIARMLERLHRDKNLAIDVDIDGRAVFRGERGDLDELVGNLLENAAKWCKSRVKVKVSRLDDGIELIVDDDGPGLAPEHRAEALERGKRLDETAPGTGLGLSIVTELADIYGGRFYLEDSPMGGLRARLDLPAAPL